jgi:DNA gyrase subunit B
VRTRYVKLAEAIGLPPFTISNAKRTETAETYEELRHSRSTLAKEGIQLSRFKGLGEMNRASSGRRRWIPRAAADPRRRRGRLGARPLFSMLMGDQVEPRRLFIESNAKDVQFLDV